MPPKKRNNHSPMVAFMNEKRKELENLNQVHFKFPFDVDLYEICKPMFEKLSVEEKNKYKVKGKQSEVKKSNTIQTQGVEKNTPEIKKSNNIQTQADEKVINKEIEYRTIENSLNCNNDKILNKDIFLIHVNWYLTIMKDYVPAEIAIVKFSLLDGIKDIYHGFPKVYDLFPLPTTLGYARTQSENTHKIPVFDMDNLSKDFSPIFNEIIQFLSKGTEKCDNTIYQLYTMNDNEIDLTSRSAVETFLDTIVHHHNQTRGAHKQFFQVYDLSKLFSELKRKDSRIPKHLYSRYNELFCEKILRRDSYSRLKYSKIGCSYHKKQDYQMYCSQSRVTCWVYIICNQCSFFGMPFIPGKHMAIDSHDDYQEDEEAAAPSAYDSTFDSSDSEERTPSSESDTSEDVSTGTAINRRESLVLCPNDDTPDPDYDYDDEW